MSRDIVSMLGDIIFSAYDMFVTCDVTSLIDCLFRSIAGTGDLLGKHALGIIYSDNF